LTSRSDARQAHARSILPEHEAGCLSGTHETEREREGGGRKKKRAIRAGGHKQSRKTNTQSCSGIPGSGFPIVLSIKTSQAEDQAHPGFPKNSGSRMGQTQQGAFPLFF